MNVHIINTITIKDSKVIKDQRNGVFAPEMHSGMEVLDEFTMAHIFTAPSHTYDVELHIKFDTEEIRLTIADAKQLVDLLNPYIQE